MGLLANKEKTKLVNAKKLYSKLYARVEKQDIETLGAIRIRTLGHRALREFVKQVRRDNQTDRSLIVALVALEGEVKTKNLGHYRGMNSYLLEACVALAKEGHGQTAANLVTPILLSRLKEFVKQVNYYGPSLETLTSKKQKNAQDRNAIVRCNAVIGLARYRCSSIVRVLEMLRDRYEIRLKSNAAKAMEAFRSRDENQMRQTVSV
jgi:hypothetical protein